MVFSIRGEHGPARAPLEQAGSRGIGGLLSPSEGAAVEVLRPGGSAQLLLVCEHASNRMPQALGTLGLDGDALESHIAWDPGAAEVTRHLADLLDATAVLQRFSRLVQDCNRPPEADDAMPVQSEVWEVPGNRNLTPRQRQARCEALYQPFHDRIEALLDRGDLSALVTVHTFTPVYLGQSRSVEVGLLHDTDPRLVDNLLEASTDCDLDLRRNEPYGPEDGVTHTLRRHALPRGLPNVMFEIRNDLVRDSGQQKAMAERLADWLTRALPAVAPRNG